MESPGLEVESMRMYEKTVTFDQNHKKLFIYGFITLLKVFIRLFQYNKVSIPYQSQVNNLLLIPIT